ncbi:sigma 54-interacting transcriptional regulator [Nannocystaceae bacterium ST9]
MSGIDLTLPTATVQASRTERRLRELTVRVLDGSPAELTLCRQIIRGGRSRASDIVLDHPSVSGLHFELHLSETGVELIDLQSRNGCWLQGRRVFRIQMRPGDTFLAGECRIQLAAAGEVEVEVSQAQHFGDLRGRSRPMRELFAQLERLAPTPVDILVLGETGTGKELVSRALHSQSLRASGPFRVLDCGGLVPSLAEAAIFGHRKGAFTGADRDQPGVFEEANGGTLLLDEIGELPLDLQVKLLRALDRREVSRVGEPAKIRSVDVRVVAATHRDVRRMVAEGRFREDLYFRLARAVLELPPLRERGEDIGLLAREFLSAACTKHSLDAELGEDAEPALRRHAWPGNVRELKNVIEHAAFLVQGRPIAAADLALDVPPRDAVRMAEFLRVDSYWSAHDELDRILLARILGEAGGNLSQAARRLELSRPKLRKRLKELGLYVPDSE